MDILRLHCERKVHYVLHFLSNKDNHLDLMALRLEKKLGFKLIMNNYRFVNSYICVSVLPMISLKKRGIIVFVDETIVF